MARGSAACYSAACEICGVEIPVRVSTRLGYNRRIDVMHGRLAKTLRAHMSRVHKKHFELADIRKLMRPQFHGTEDW